MTKKTLGKTDSLLDQTLASLVQMANAARDAAGVVKVDAQNLLFERASIYMDTVREFVDKPDNILGSPLTKHGEIAEVAEVGLRNAWDILNDIDPSASLHPDRIGPIDYRVLGDEVQSKFYNGVRNTLSGVTGHLGKYPEFFKSKSYYAIPKDQHELLTRVLNGEPTGLSQKSLDALKKSVGDIETLTGRDFGEAVRPASFAYAEVQTGAIDKTLDSKQEELDNANEERVKEIHADHAPCWKEGLQATGAAAAAGAGVSFLRAVFGKYREGKNIFRGDFTAADWKDLGLDTSKGAAIGGASGGALYFMTNCTDMSAPLAGAVVSAAKGLAPLMQGYRAGELSLEQLVDTGCIVCAEAGMVAAAAVIGQAVIPVPILGAFIGSIAGQTLSSILKKELIGSADAISKRVAEYTSALSDRQKQILNGLLEQYAKLGELTVAAFDLRLNADILASSATLARTYGIEESKTLKTTGDVDRYMLA